MMPLIENMTRWTGFKTALPLKKYLKDPLYLGAGLTLLILATGGTFFSTVNHELKQRKEAQTVAKDMIAQKERELILVRNEVKKITARLQKKPLIPENLTVNERKMSQVLEKMALSAAGKFVEVVAFRPESLTEEEKDILLTVNVKVKTRFSELERYLSRLSKFPQSVKIDRLKIETLENESPMIYADLLVLTRIKKD